MGLSEEAQKDSQRLRLLMNGETNVGKSVVEMTQAPKIAMNTATSQDDVMGCCQENGSSSCCQNPVLPEQRQCSDANETAGKVTAEKKKSSRKLRTNSGKGAFARKVCAMPTWLESWEREDTYAALAVVCAAVSVAIAYSCYKQQLQ